MLENLDLEKMATLVAKSDRLCHAWTTLKWFYTGIRIQEESRLAFLRKYHRCVDTKPKVR